MNNKSEDNFNTLIHLVDGRKDPAVVFADAVDFSHFPRGVV